MATKITTKKSVAPKATKPAGALEMTVYTQEGKAHGKTELPKEFFGLPANNKLLHQVVYSMEANARRNTAHTKFRGEVRGGGKKPWKQKGTGRARHGSSRSPIWVGGGVTHGPRAEKNYEKKINRQVRAKALFTALSGKIRDNELVLIDKLSLSPKTKDAEKALGALSKVKGLESISRKNNAALIAVPTKTPELARAFSNMRNVLIEETRNLNALDILRYRHLVLVDIDAALKIFDNKKNKK